MLTIYSSTSMLKITKPVLIHVAYCNSRKNKIKNHANCSKIKKPMMTTRLVRTPNIFLKICFIRAVSSPFFIQTLFCLSGSCISRSPAVMHSKQEMNHVIRHTTKAKLTFIVYQIFKRMARGTPKVYPHRISFRGAFPSGVSGRSDAAEKSQSPQLRLLQWGTPTKQTPLPFSIAETADKEESAKQSSAAMPKAAEKRYSEIPVEFLESAL